MNTTIANQSTILSSLELAAMFSLVSAESIVGIPDTLLLSTTGDGESEERFQVGVDSLVTRNILTKEDGKYDTDPFLLLHIAVMAGAWVACTVELDGDPRPLVYYCSNGLGTEQFQNDAGDYVISRFRNTDQLIGRIQQQFKLSTDTVKLGTITIQIAQADSDPKIETLVVMIGDGDLVAVQSDQDHGGPIEGNTVSLVEKLKAALNLI